MVKLTPTEKQVVDQIKENCDFWGSDMCKTATVLKYCQEERGIYVADRIIADLIMRDVLYSPKPGYISIRDDHREDCWINGGLEARAKEKGSPLTTDCIGKTVCLHFIKCTSGKIRKPAVEGGDLMTDTEIQEWAEDQRKGLELLRKRYPALEGKKNA